MALPNEPGFAVNLKSDEVHKRYADHARSFRRTTAAGVANLLDGREPVLCLVCYPPPPKTSTRFTPKPVKFVEVTDAPVPNAQDLLADREAKMKKADDGADDEG